MKKSTLKTFVLIFVVSLFSLFLMAGMLHAQTGASGADDFGAAGADGIRGNSDDKLFEQQGFFEP